MAYLWSYPLLCLFEGNKHAADAWNNTSLRKPYGGIHISIILRPGGLFFFLDLLIDILNVLYLSIHIRAEIKPYMYHYKWALNSCFFFNKWFIHELHEQ